MSARDKLEEADFFLQKLRRATADQEQRYLFSAFISAWRSVTFVLQKDYRGKYRDKFNEWYSEKQLSLRESEGASDLLKIRTVLQKEGNKYPERVLNINTVDGDEITAVWDMSRGMEGLLSFKVSYGKGRIVNSEGDAETKSEIIRYLPCLLVEVPRLVKEASNSTVSYRIGDNYQSITFEEVVRLCEVNLHVVSNVVHEAEDMFGKPTYA